MAAQRTRKEILRAALREAAAGFDVLGAPTSGGADRDRERRRWLAKLQRAEAVEFVRGILDTAAALQRARTAGGEAVFRTDVRYTMLVALEQIRGWPSISELGRALRISKQAAREQVIAAAHAGLLELVPDPGDRRSIQIGLTPAGKAELAVGRGREFTRIATLLRGLGAPDMRLVAHVLRVMRERLLRSES
jgi:DNA-binding MarR family transcriptional regulator